VALVGLALDQVTKWQAVERLTGRDDVQVVGELLQLRLIYNPGAAFGAGPELTVGIACLAVVATLVVVYVARRVATPMWGLSLGLMLAGITGNLVDRIFQAPGPMRGHVIDFLMLPHWPIFNLADVCLVSGVVGVVIQTFRGIGLDGTRERQPGTSQPEGSQPGESQPGESQPGDEA